MRQLWIEGAKRRREAGRLTKEAITGTEDFLARLVYKFYPIES